MFTLLEVQRCLICSKETDQMILLNQTWNGWEAITLENALQYLQFPSIANMEIDGHVLCVVCVAKVQICYKLKMKCYQIEKDLEISSESTSCERSIGSTVLPINNVIPRSTHVEIIKVNSSENDNLEVITKREDIFPPMSSTMNHSPTNPQVNIGNISTENYNFQEEDSHEIAQIKEEINVEHLETNLAHSEIKPQMPVVLNDSDIKSEIDIDWKNIVVKDETDFQSVASDDMNRKDVNVSKENYICPLCDENFANNYQLRQHFVIHNGDVYICKDCKKTFKKIEYLYTHRRVHTGEKPFACDVCRESFHRRSQLRYHKHSHTDENPYVCDVCDKLFAGMESLNTHKLIHSGKKYVCDICNKSFYLLSKLRAHQQLHTGIITHVCGVCDQSFCGYQNFYKHKMTHNEHRTYVCNVCDKKFAKQNDLIIHKRIHTGEKPYACDVCDKRFYRTTLLKIHKATHLGEKKFVCDVCNKSFTSGYNLKSHKLRHTGVVTHVCDVCNKSFYGYPDFRKHRMAHNARKPHVCDVCDKAFTRSSHLIIHKRIHTGEKPYVCDVCNESFVQSSTLKVHKLKHTEKPRCEICNVTRSSPGNLKSHIKRCHPNEVMK